MNGNPKVSDRHRKKELKIIVVVRLLEGNDESQFCSTVKMIYR